MPTIKVDLLNVDKVKDILLILQDILNDDKLSYEMREKYGSRLKELGL